MSTLYLQMDVKTNLDVDLDLEILTAFGIEPPTEKERELSNLSQGEVEYLMHTNSNFRKSMELLESFEIGRHSGERAACVAKANSIPRSRKSSIDVPESVPEEKNTWRRIVAFFRAFGAPIFERRENTSIYNK